MRAIVRIKNLEYSYPDGTKALRGIDLSVREGESVGIVGPNGAGKTTLLLHLNGVLRGKGHIEIAGSEITDENLRAIRSDVGLVFQDPDDQLFMPTVFDDVAFGPINMGLEEAEVRRRVGEALEIVELSGMEERVTHHLSFGEKKRVAIATVLPMEPEILALDEPSSNLDPHARRELMNLLKRLPATKIIAGHDLDFILETCERVILLEGGRIVADGPAGEILSDKDLLESHRLELPLGVRSPHFTFNKKFK